MEDGTLLPASKYKPDEDLASGLSYKKVPSAEHVRRFLSQRWKPVEEETNRPGTGCGCKSRDECDPNSWAYFYKRAQEYYLCVSGMAFQDVWNIDLERLKRCCVHVVTPKRRMIPFCAYYLTSLKGKGLYCEEKVDTV